MPLLSLEFLSVPFTGRSKNMTLRTKPSAKRGSAVLQSCCLMLLLFCALCNAGCGIYSFSGASVEGKTIRFSVLENKARNVVPTLAPTLTEKLRNRILSQTGLTPVNSPAAEADYEISGTITSYEVTVTGVQNVQQASQNQLTIGITIVFKNRLNPKANFTQGFSRFSPFPPQSLTAVEVRLIDDISTQLADDVFNKAFVNW